MERASYSLSVGAQRKHRGRFGVFGLIVCVFVVYAVVVVLDPWAFHIGERWTPLLYWTGTRQTGYEARNLPADGYLSSPRRTSPAFVLMALRPTGGIQGNGLMCTSRGVTQYLDLSGTIYGGWRSTDGALMDFRLLERRTARDALMGNNNRGYFDLFGYWHGPWAYELISLHHILRCGLRADWRSPR